MARTKATKRPTRRHSNSKTLSKRKRVSSRLPIEVCERIIDFVAQLWNLERLRSRTLRACALTCRAWTPRSVYHIVSKYDNIRTEDEFSRYVFLLQKYPLFARYVTELNISPDPYDGTPTWVNLLPQAFSPLLTGLEFLNLSSESFDDSLVFHSRFFPWLSRFKTVTELHYHLASQRSFSDLVRFTTAFPNIQILLIGRDVYWDDHRLPVAVCPRNSARLCLTHLILSDKLDVIVRTDIFNWLAGTSTVSTLTSLEVWEGFGKTLDKDVSQSLRSFVLACGNLRHLLVCSTTPGYPEIESLDLRSNLLLKSLELIFEEYNEKVSSHIVTVLSEASSHLNKLTLRFNLLDDPNDDILLGCEVMDDVLSAPRFLSLRDFTIDFDVKPEASFPKLWAKRVRVGVVDSESTKTLFKRRHTK